MAIPTPLHDWRLDETSGTSAADQQGGPAATANGGLTMGGIDALSSIGGKAVLMDGVDDYIQLSTSPLLAGLSTWTITAEVMNPQPGDTDAPIYAEKSAAGNSLLALAIGASNSLRLQVKDSAAGSTDMVAAGGQGTMWPGTAWYMVAARRNGTVLDVSKNAGVVITGTAPAGVLDNSDIDTRAGSAGTRFAKIGLSRLRIWNVVLTDDQLWELVRRDAPRTRQTAFAFPAAPNSIWRKPLDDNAALHANSANFITEFTRIRGLYAYGPSIGSGGYSVPVFIVPQTTPRVPVRFEGGRDSNAGSDPNALFDAFQSVPVPDNAFSATGTDAHMAIYLPRTDEFWEMWVARKALLPAAWVSLADVFSGSLPSANYRYVITNFNANGENTSTRKGVTGTVSGGTAKVSWQGETVANATSNPPCLGFRIYRQLQSDNTAIQFLAEVPATGLDSYTFNDDGSIALTPARTIPFDYSQGVNAATTSDWSCRYGGYMPSVQAGKGHYVSPHANWGSTATSIPNWGGLITIEEAMAASEGNVDAIPHALAMALPIAVAANTFFYPAQRTDGAYTNANAIREGTRFRLPASLDLSTLGLTPFGQAVARAFQRYGGYVRDVSGGISICYVEDATNAGPNFEQRALGGYNVFNTQSNYVFKNFPWTSLQVVDPTYTQAQTSGGTFTPVPVIQATGRRRARY